MQSNILVVYYSYEGSTKLIAETIAQKLNADLLECKPEKDINAQGFSKYFWGGRQVLMKKKPKLKAFSKNPNDYDIIIIGTPVWAYNYTPAIRSFLTKFNLENKKIALYCCHEGGPGKTFKNLREKLSNNTIIAEMDYLNVSDHKEENIEKATQWATDLKNNI